MTDKALLSKENRLTDGLVYPCPNDQKVLEELGIDADTYQDMADEARDEEDLEGSLRRKGCFDDENGEVESTVETDSSSSSDGTHYTFGRRRFKSKKSRQNVMSGKLTTRSRLDLSYDDKTC